MLEGSTCPEVKKKWPLLIQPIRLGRYSPWTSKTVILPRWMKSPCLFFGSHPRCKISFRRTCYLSFDRRWSCYHPIASSWFRCRRFLCLSSDFLCPVTLKGRKVDSEATSFGFSRHRNRKAVAGLGIMRVSTGHHVHICHDDRTMENFEAFKRGNSKDLKYLPTNWRIQRP